MMPPPLSYPSSDFDGGGLGLNRRRYDEDFDEEDLHQGEEDWFYRHHRNDGHPYDHFDDHPPSPQSFPPPPLHYQHPRFVERLYPHVIISDYPAEVPQSQLFTTTTTTRRGKESSFEHRQDTQHHREQTTGSFPIQSIWKTSSPVLVQSSTLQTFAFDTPAVERVQVLLKKGHRHGRSRNDPLQARIDVWHGPDSTPQNLAIYMENDDIEDDDEGFVFGDLGSPEEDDDDTTNFSAIIQTPQGYNTIAVRNTASNCDLLACVEGEECQKTTHSSYNNGVLHHHVNGDPSGYYYEEPYRFPFSSNSQEDDDAMQSQPNNDDASSTTSSSPLQSVIERLMATSTAQCIEGTTNIASAYTPSSAVDKPIRPHVHAVNLAPNVASVQILLRTEYMRPLQARVELILMERSSNNKSDPCRVLKRTIVEVFSEDGMHRPFFAVLETPKKRKNRTRRKQEQCGDDDDEKIYSVSLRVSNLSGSEFPFFASVEPYVIDTTNDNDGTGTCGSSNNYGELESEHSQDGAAGNHELADDVVEGDWWEQSMENSHFGGGSHYDFRTNSTILDAEIL
jgi:hypothetical protein